MNVAELDEVTADAWEDGEQVCETLARKAWQRGAWATVLLLCRRRARGDGAWDAPRVELVRLARRGEGWRVHARAPLADAEEARALAATLVQWFGDATRA